VVVVVVVVVVGTVKVVGMVARALGVAVVRVK
jgi:hypothetical protein